MTAAPRSDALSANQFSELLSATQGPLYGFVRRLVGAEEEARDLVQDVFVDAWRLARRAEPPFAALEDMANGGIRRWLFHAAYCAAVSALRHRGVIAWESLDAPDAPTLDRADDAPAFDTRIVDRDALVTALVELPPPEVAALLLNIVYGFPSPEIARILDITPDAARKRLSRGMQRLRAAYFAREDPATGRERHERKERPTR
ncbi:MAG TPA: sigma-70 family RNA polymerase sigma factor [Ktedonobacterales bacterium]